MNATTPKQAVQAEKWVRLAVHADWVKGAKITESVRTEANQRRFVANIRGWGGWFLCECSGLECGAVVPLIIEKVREILSRIDAGDESVFEFSSKVALIELPAPISGGSPEAEAPKGGQHAAPATDGNPGEDVLVRAVVAYRESLAKGDSPRRAARLVREFWRELSAAEKADAAAELARGSAGVRADDCDWMLEGWFAAYVLAGGFPRVAEPCPLSASEVVEAEIAAARGEGRPMSGLAWCSITPGNRWAIGVMVRRVMGAEAGTVHLEQLRAFAKICAEGSPVSFPPPGGDFDEADLPETTKEAEAMMDEMGVMPVSGGAPDGPKWTGGEWMNLGHDGHGGITIGTDEVQIGYVSHGNMANADLMVAAPEMAKEIESMALLCRSMGEAKLGGWDWPAIAARLEALHAKALGIPPISGGAPEPELLPCPFCGSPDIEHGAAEDSTRGRAFASCNRCGATIEDMHAWQVRKLWNTRAPHPDHAAVMADLPKILRVFEDRLMSEDEVRVGLEAVERLQAAVNRWKRPAGESNPATTSGR